LACNLSLCIVIYNGWVILRVHVLPPGNRCQNGSSLLVKILIEDVLLVPNKFFIMLHKSLLWPSLIQLDLSLGSTYCFQSLRVIKSATTFTLRFHRGEILSLKSKKLVVRVLLRVDCLIVKILPRSFPIFKLELLGVGCLVECHQPLTLVMCSIHIAFGLID
jgi:hypothetical protein